MNNQDLAQAMIVVAQQIAEEVAENSKPDRCSGDHIGSPTAIKRQCVMLREMALKLSKKV